MIRGREKMDKKRWYKEGEENKNSKSKTGFKGKRQTKFVEKRCYEEGKENNNVNGKSGLKHEGWTKIGKKKMV